MRLAQVTGESEWKNHLCTVASLQNQACSLSCHRWSFPPFKSHLIVSNQPFVFPLELKPFDQSADLISLRYSLCCCTQRYCHSSWCPHIIDTCKHLISLSKINWWFLTGKPTVAWPGLLHYYWLFSQQSNQSKYIHSLVNIRAARHHVVVLKPGLAGAIETPNGVHAILNISLQFLSGLKTLPHDLRNEQPCWRQVLRPGTHQCPCNRAGWRI